MADDETKKGAPSIDQFKTMVRMNPALRKAGLDTAQSAGELKAQLEEAKKNVRVKQAIEGGAAVEKAATIGAPTLATAIASLEEKFFTEQTAHMKQIQELQVQERELPKNALDRIVHAILTHDPRMASPKTQELLRLDREFLDAIGFTPKSVPAALAEKLKKS